MSDEHWMRQQEEIDYLMKEFKRLEKVAMIVENKFNEEIAELRKRVDDLNDINGEAIDSNADKLNELKEVQWDLITIAGKYDPKINKLLAKLSGVGSARQTETYKDLPKIANDGTYHIVNIGEETEKKEVVSVAMRECFPEIYNEDGTKKESGGVKPREDDEYNVIKHRYKKGNFHESIYYDPKLYIIVKREDLQWLFEYTSSEGIFDDDCLDEYWVEKKRIKEVYGIK